MPLTIYFLNYSNKIFSVLIVDESLSSDDVDNFKKQIKPWSLPGALSILAVTSFITIDNGIPIKYSTGAFDGEI